MDKKIIEELKEKLEKQKDSLQKELKNFEAIKAVLDIGDFLEIQGSAFKTQRGEKSIFGEKRENNHKKLATFADWLVRPSGYWNEITETLSGFNFESGNESDFREEKRFLGERENLFK